ncbi:MoaD/ThiS family protein [bacterium]|nr:MAG: MoaD/ThiS family protein [bacterium]RIK63777.1 MAG: molybdopterin synthase sulfur carrier subunit [Planctomycetota bacterium]
MQVLIPSPLISYTRKKYVEAHGATLGELLSDLERQFPGIRFRMIDEQDRVRPHMRIFINGEQEFSLGRALAPTDEISIVQALSGG